MKTFESEYIDVMRIYLKQSLQLKRTDFDKHLKRKINYISVTRCFNDFLSSFSKIKLEINIGDINLFTQMEVFVLQDNP